ncbi:MAG: CapA family protein [Bacteroidales bacterium]|nr:CapA family protein [Bacteroidales bacterium]
MNIFVFRYRHLTLNTVRGHISGTIAAVIALTAGCISSYAQSLRIPERWMLNSTEVPSLFSRDTMTICVMGDIMMHSRQIEDALQSDGTYEFRCFDIIRSRIESADIAVANMEFTLAGKPYAGYPQFSAPDSFATYLAECGFDIFLTANNHILDRGSAGALRTLEIYKELESSHGIRYTGSHIDPEDESKRNPLHVRRKGYDLAFVNLTYGTNLGKTEIWPGINYLGEQKKTADMMRSKADITMVFPHWGQEYALKHSAAQEKTASWLAENGADLILGAHPHVVQDYGTTGPDNTPVAYSLGNAVSNMSAENTQIELMATVKITRDKNGDPQILPIEFTYLWCSRPGGYTDTYMVLPVTDFIGTRDIWTGKWEYDKMMKTYYHVMNETGIKDKINE